MDSARAEMVTLWAAQEPRVRRYLRRAVGMREADDLVHQTFIEAARCWGRYDRRGSRAAWLFGIARNVARRALRQARRRRMESLAAEPTARAEWTSASALEETTHSGAACESADRVGRMREAIANLPDHLRETLVLRLVCEMTYEEIAAVLEIPIGTVRSRLHEAVRRLREHLTQDESCTR